MHFVIIANSWSAAADNPTSKHQIAMELVRAGHRVLWLEGAGMRRPSLGSGSDRARMLKKVLAAMRGPQEQRIEDSGYRMASGPRPSTICHRSASLHVLAPLLIPLPTYAVIRWLNGGWFATCARFWAWRLGFVNPVLINYVPVLAYAQSAWHRTGKLQSDRVTEGQGKRDRGAELKGKRDGASVLQGEEDGGRQAEAQDQRACEESRAGCEHPELCHFVTLQPCHPTSVYHCVDRWDSFGTYDAGMMRKVDEQCCRHADVVIASSRELFERCRSYNPHTHLVNHGVDLAHFRKAVDETQAIPVDLPTGGPIIGFVGLLSEWVDQDLIIRLAKEMPRAHVMLIGKADVDVERLKALPNIHCLGPKPYRELPAYLARCTVTIIPFKINELTRAVNPIKLREMLAAGCPVVSTALPEVKSWIEGAGDGVRSFAVCAETERAFVDRVRERIEQPVTAETRRTICTAVEDETWASKTQEILRHVRTVSA
jgi:hypothetical protein